MYMVNPAALFAELGYGLTNRDVIYGESSGIVRPDHV